MQLGVQVKPQVHSIPVVATISDPVALGIVGNLARPDANITGINAAGQPSSVSRARIKAAFAPYRDKGAAGAREFALASAAGCTTAVTTRPGMGFLESASHLTAAARLGSTAITRKQGSPPVLAAKAMWNCFRAGAGRASDEQHLSPSLR